MNDWERKMKKVFPDYPCDDECDRARSPTGGCNLKCKKWDDWFEFHYKTIIENAKKIKGTNER